MKGRLQAALIALAMAAGCGGPESDPQASLQLNLRMHDLKCDRTGILAKLEVIGAPACDLTVNPDRTVSGLCSQIPTGQTRQFRLVYFVQVTNEPDLVLATSLESVDLTGQTDPEIVLVFDSINTYPDDDNDAATNLEEWCNGDDPRGL